MQAIKELNSQFSIPGLVTIEEGKGGLPYIKVRNALAEADIYLQGATVTHFQPKGQRPVLWLSSRSLFAVDKPIRGGIPICWPWFGLHPGDKAKPQHGFARKMAWDILQIVQTSDERTRVILQLKSGESTLALFPHDFVLTYTVVVGRSLEAELSVHNPGEKPFACTEALHAYFLVGDSEKVRVTGLQNTAYVDKVKDMQHFVQVEQALDFTAHQDRIYMQAPNKVLLEDPGLGRVLNVEKAFAKDLVAWNPQARLAATIADMGQGEWRTFVCLEAANTAQNPVEVPALSTHTIQTKAGIP